MRFKLDESREEASERARGPPVVALLEYYEEPPCIRRFPWELDAPAASSHRRTQLLVRAAVPVSESCAVHLDSRLPHSLAAVQSDSIVSSGMRRILGAWSEDRDSRHRRSVTPFRAC